MKYMVCRTEESLEETFLPFVEEICKHRQCTRRTIVFCQTYDSTSRIYLFLRHCLVEAFTYPSGAPDITQFRIVEMFSACSRKDVKEAILSRFKRSTSLRVVIATIAFGMGLDCPDIRRIVHYGIPADIESFVQETGRGGRDGLPAESVLFYSSANLGLSTVEESMKEYCRNTTRCRRQLLFNDFDQPIQEAISGCVCCDVCTDICKYYLNHG